MMEVRVLSRSRINRKVQKEKKARFQFSFWTFLFSARSAMRNGAADSSRDCWRLDKSLFQFLFWPSAFSARSAIRNGAADSSRDCWRLNKSPFQFAWRSAFSARSAVSSGAADSSRDLLIGDKFPFQFAFFGLRLFQRGALWGTAQPIPLVIVDD